MAQPTDTQLQEAWRKARQTEEHAVRGMRSRYLQDLINLRNLRTTWVYTQELQLRRDLDAYISQRRAAMR